jgi:hypothetical protein
MLGEEERTEANRVDIREAVSWMRRGLKVRRKAWEPKDYIKDVRGILAEA